METERAEEMQQALQDLADEIDSAKSGVETGGRELSLAATNLDQARLWLMEYCAVTAE